MDYCGEYTGLRVSEQERTVQVMWKFAGQWRCCGEPRPYPLPEADFSSPPSIPEASLFDLVLANLKSEAPSLADEVKVVLSSPRQPSQ